MITTGQDIPYVFEVNLTTPTLTGEDKYFERWWKLCGRTEIPKYTESGDGNKCRTC